MVKKVKVEIGWWLQLRKKAIIWSQNNNAKILFVIPRTKSAKYCKWIRYSSKNRTWLEWVEVLLGCSHDHGVVILFLRERGKHNHNASVVGGLLCWKIHFFSCAFWFCTRVERKRVHLYLFSLLLTSGRPSRYWKAAGKCIFLSTRETLSWTSLSNVFRSINKDRGRLRSVSNLCYGDVPARIRKFCKYRQKNGFSHKHGQKQCRPALHIV